MIFDLSKIGNIGQKFFFELGVPWDRGTPVEQPGTLEVFQRWTVSELFKKSFCVALRAFFHPWGERSHHGKCNDTHFAWFGTLGQGVIQQSVQGHTLAAIRYPPPAHKRYGAGTLRGQF